MKSRGYFSGYGKTDGISRPFIFNILDLNSAHIVRKNEILIYELFPLLLTRYIYIYADENNDDILITLITHSALITSWTLITSWPGP